MLLLISVLLTIGAVMLGVVGIGLLSNATAGVGAIALACLAGILARLAQAAYYENLRHRDLAASRSTSRSIPDTGLPEAP